MARTLRAPTALVEVSPPRGRMQRDSGPFLPLREFLSNRSLREIVFASARCSMLSPICYFNHTNRDKTKPPVTTKLPATAFAIVASLALAVAARAAEADILLDKLPEAVQRDTREAMQATAGNTGMVLSVALNYGGRAEIVDAMNAILADGCDVGIAVMPRQNRQQEGGQYLAFA